MELWGDLEIRLSVRREMGHGRSTVPGILNVWNRPYVRHEEAHAAIRPASKDPDGRHPGFGALKQEVGEDEGV